MPRVGHIYSNVVPGTSTQALDFHSFLSANLTTWTLGAIQTINSGTQERNYFVLTHASGAEILVYAPQGTSTTGPDMAGGINSSYVESTNVSSSTDNPLALAVAPQGGYTSSFNLTQDPAGTDFWPATSSKVAALDYWSRSQPNMEVYVIENTDFAELFVYVGRTVLANGVGMAIVGYSSNMHTPLVNSPYQSDGFMYVGTSSSVTSAPKVPRMAMSFWSDIWVTGNWATTTTTQYPARQNLTGLTDSNQPASDGSYLVKTLPFIDAPNGKYIGIYNPEILTEVGRMTATYGTKRGPSATPWLHIWIDYFTVWAQNLPAPVVG